MLIASGFIFFLIAGQDFICSCLLLRLLASIYSNRKFIFFMDALVWLWTSFPLLSVLLLCLAYSFPGCISSFIWEGVLLVGKMLALQFMISLFPAILFHHSNPNILISRAALFSSMTFFCLLLHLVLDACFGWGINNLWMYYQTMNGVWG